MRLVLTLLFIAAVSASAQLVQKKPSAADSIDLSGGTKNRPSTMDSREYSNDSTMGTVIGIGAKFVGETMKNMLSPNSAEADAVEREWQKR